MKFKYLLFGIMLLALIGNISAWSTNVLYNGTTSYTSENISGTDELVIRYLKVPTNTYLINGYLNLTGYGVGNTEFIYQENANETSVDNGDPYGIIYENYTKLTGSTDSSLLMLKMSNFTYNFSLSNCWGTDTKLQFMFTARDYYGISGAYMQNNTIYCKVDGNWIFINNTHFQTPAGTVITASNDYYLRAYDGNWNTGSTKGHSGQWYYATSGACNDALIYEDAMIWDIKPVYPSDITIWVGDDEIFTQSGTFNITNKTNNIASNINSITNTCTCTSCSLSGGNCNVPFFFQSIGYFNYNNLIFNNVGWIENSQTYNSNVYEMSSQTFLISTLYDPNLYTSSLANLVYDGISYKGIRTMNGSNTIFSRTISLPLVSSAINKTFYWINCLII